MAENSLSALVSLARRECCNWFDNGSYCPLCEKYENRTCRIVLGIPCEYFGLCLALTDNPIHKDNANFDGGKLRKLYKDLVLKEDQPKVEVRRCKCGRQLMPRQRHCEKCSELRRKKTFRESTRRKRDNKKV